MAVTFAISFFKVVTFALTVFKVVTFANFANVTPRDPSTLERTWELPTKALRVPPFHPVGHGGELVPF